MQVNAISGFGLKNNSLQYKANTKPKQSSNKANDYQSLSFLGENKNSKGGKSLRNAAIAMFLVPIVSPLMTSCGEIETDAWAKAEAYATDSTSTTASIIDTTEYEHPADTIIKWYYDYERPWPLDSLLNNFQNWEIDGTEDVDSNDSTANRNIIHYEGDREWEYNNREIGDINMLESQGRNLVYDTEILDYMGNHISYGKSVLRVPNSTFTVTTSDGRVLNSPKGFFYEEYTNDNDEKGGSIYDCTLQTRAFCQTNGDTLIVSKRSGTSEYYEKGKAAKGYLGANTVLLRNLIGEYSTDDHYVNMEVEAVDDETLRLMYLKAKDEEE